MSLCSWKCALELDSTRCITRGTSEALHADIRAGADLRIYTSFRHNEHLAPGSGNAELVHEVSEFRVTYLIADAWMAGIMTLRMPIMPPDGFGPRPSMSFFLYNEDGGQAIARPYLDGAPSGGSPGESPARTYPEMPLYHERDRWDDGTNAPSSNFAYDFEAYRYFTSSTWQEVFHHDEHGELRSGSLESLTDAFMEGAEMKVAFSGLCDELAGDDALNHEVFVQVGPGYYHENSRLFTAGTHPVVRVAPAIPMRYESGNWDFGWLMPRTDGLVECWLCDPYTLAFRREQKRLALRWFVRR